jgi:hypothetical protein
MRSGANSGANFAGARFIGSLMANDPIPPRLMSGKAAAAYCGVAAPTFAKWVAAGLMPAPVMGRRWDRKAIDIALDLASGIRTTRPAEYVDELAIWQRDHDRSRDPTMAASGSPTEREPWQDKFDDAWAEWLVEYPPSEGSSAADVEKGRQAIWVVWKDRYGRKLR